VTSRAGAGVRRSAAGQWNETMGQDRSQARSQVDLGVWPRPHVEKMPCASVPVPVTAAIKSTTILATVPKVSVTKLATVTNWTATTPATVTHVSATQPKAATDAAITICRTTIAANEKPVVSD
jgi:hypothetical protein